MDCNFSVLRETCPLTGQYLYTIHLEPTDRQKVCEGVELLRAVSRFAEFCSISQREAFKRLTVERDDWTELRLQVSKPVGRLGDVL